MLFGTSRVISEYLQKGDNYDKITKVTGLAEEDIQSLYPN